MVDSKRQPLNLITKFTYIITTLHTNTHGKREIMSGTEKVVCVTGASGYIASWLVKLLLQRGYTVKAIVHDPIQYTHSPSLFLSQIWFLSVSVASNTVLACFKLWVWFNFFNLTHLSLDVSKCCLF